jgi:site-specific DNA recombinase
MNKEYFKRFVKTEKEEIKNNEVWVYTRVSSKNQFDSNHSIENQISSAVRLANKLNYKITREFGNTYESAKDDFTRKEFTKLIKEVKESVNKPFGIMIYKMSRFSRTGAEAIGLLAELVKVHGVHLIEVSTETDTSTVIGELRIMDSLVNARRENVERLTFTIPGLKSFVGRGNWLGKSPRGYDHYGPRVKNPKFIQGVQELRINEEGKLLRLAWQWKLQNIPDYQIIDRLKVRGLKVSKQFVSAMWRNPFYCGVQLNKFLEGKVIRGNWEGLVSEEDFRTINDRLQSKPKNEYNPYTSQKSRPLQSQLYCGCCGSKMTGYKAKGKYDYYKCLNSSCTSKDINANSGKKSLNEGAHDLFKDLLSSLQLNKTLQEVFKEQMRLTINGQNKVFFEEESRLKNRIEELNRKLDGLDRKYAFDDLDKDLVYQI